MLCNGEPNRLEKKLQSLGFKRLAMCQKSALILKLWCKEAGLVCLLTFGTCVMSCCSASDLKLSTGDFGHLSLKRSQRVFSRRLFASRWFSEVLVFRSSDSHSLNQGYTAWFQQSTMSLLNRSKPLADTSNKTTAPHPPRQYGNNHISEVLHDGIWGAPANPLSRNLVEKLPTKSPRCARNANNVGQDIPPNDGSQRKLPEAFCAWRRNLWKSVNTFENIWKSLKTSANLWKLLETSARKTSRR